MAQRTCCGQVQMRWWTVMETTSWGGGRRSLYRLDLMEPDSTTGFPARGVIADRNGNRYQISFSGSCGDPVTDNNLNGNTSVITCTDYSSTPSITDVNGNVLTLLGTRQSDTMGRSFITLSGATPTTDLSGCVSNTWPLASATLNTYAAANGSTNQLKACYANVSIQTAFGISVSGAFGPIPVSEGQNGMQPLPMLVTLILPDGTSWKVDYDSYGNVAHLGLPLGGSIDYTWQTIASPSCGSITTVSRAVATRTIKDNNGHSFSWQYNYGAFANGGMTNTVTDPLQNDTTHQFTALIGSCEHIYETSTQEYQGTGVPGSFKSRWILAIRRHPKDGFVRHSYKTTVYPSGKVKLQRTPDAGLHCKLAYLACDPELSMIGDKSAWSTSCVRPTRSINGRRTAAT